MSLGAGTEEEPHGREGPCAGRLGPGTPLQACEAHPHLFCWVGCSLFKTQLGPLLAWALCEPAAGWHPPSAQSTQAYVSLCISSWAAVSLTASWVSTQPGYERGEGRCSARGLGRSGHPANNCSMNG